jgi:hypothetical protein
MLPSQSNPRFQLFIIKNIIYKLKQLNYRAPPHTDPKPAASCSLGTHSPSHALEWSYQNFALRINNS